MFSCLGRHFQLSCFCDKKIYHSFRDGLWFFLRGVEKFEINILCSQNSWKMCSGSLREKKSSERFLPARSYFWLYGDIHVLGIGLALAWSGGSWWRIYLKRDLCHLYLGGFATLTSVTNYFHSNNENANMANWSTFSSNSVKATTCQQVARALDSFHWLTNLVNRQKDNEKCSLFFFCFAYVMS